MAANSKYPTWVEVRQINLDDFNSCGENDLFPTDLVRVSDAEFLASLNKIFNEPDQAALVACLNCRRVEFVGLPPFNFAQFKGPNAARNDKYIYGHPKYRYHRSMKSFCEHAMWIALEELAECRCDPCIESWCYI